MIVSEEVLDNEARVNAQLTVASVRLRRLQGESNPTDRERLWKKSSISWARSFCCRRAQE
jgi:hypothetical protein